MNAKNLGFAASLLLAAAAAASPSAKAVDLAKVNGAVITDHDLQTALGNLNEGQRRNVLRDVSSRHQVLSGVIDQEVLVQEAEKEKLDQGADYKEALNAFRRQFLASRVLTRNLGTKFTEGAAKKFYEANPRRFSTEQVHALHILIRDPARANEVYNQAKGLGDDDFMALAEKISQDPSAKNNRGDLGYFGHDRMVSEFTDAAFAGAKGKVLAPVKTSYGYHIIKVLDYKPGKPLEYTDVELRVKNELRQSLTAVYVGNLRKQARIEVNSEAVDRL